MIDSILTEESNLKVLNISNTMENKTFHHHYHILYDLRTLLGPHKKVYVEIGAYAGGSASLVASHIYPTECYSIDLGYPINPDIPKRNVERFKNPNNSWEYIQGNSQLQSTVNKLKEFVNGIDLLFIDGDHSSRGVSLDFNLYAPMVNKDGYLWFDDYFDFKYSPEVRPTVDEIVKNINTDIWEVIGLVLNKFESNPKENEYLNGFLLKKL